MKNLIVKPNKNVSKKVGKKIFEKIFFILHRRVDNILANDISDRVFNTLCIKIKRHLYNIK